MSTTDASIRLSVVGGIWETIGTDRSRGIWFEGLSCSANEWGPDTASFTVRRQPGQLTPEFLPFTPIEIEVGGIVVWEGRTWETPTRGDGSVSVECRGWQYHLDDDVYLPGYVHSRLNDWKDARSFLTTALGDYPQNAQVSVDGGIVCGFPGDQAIPNLSVAAAGIDLGPGRVAKRIIISYEWQNDTGNGNMIWNTWGSNIGVGASGQLNIGGAPNPGVGAASGTVAYTPATPCRFLMIGVQSLAGGTVTPPDELRIRLTKVLLFTETAYESGNDSIIKADTVIKDARDKATVLLSASNAKIAAGAFSLPDAFWFEQRTPREVINSVNAFHDYQTRIAPGRVLEWRAKPTVPILEAGAWAGAQFSDASSNQGEEVYDRVLVQGAGPDGSQLNVVRTHPDVIRATTTPSMPNPSFTTNALDWYPTLSTITRDTSGAAYDSAPACGRWDNTGASDALAVGDFIDIDIGASYEKGKQYVWDFKLRPAGPGVFRLKVSMGYLYDFSEQEIVLLPGWNTYRLSWIPLTNVASAGGRFVVIQNATGGYLWIDSCSLGVNVPTIVTRQGFRRTKILPVDSALTIPAAEKLGDIWLAGHRTTPFRGDVAVSAPGGVRRTPQGTPVHPAELLLHTGELIRLADQIDPDTGAVGRDGRIASVSYAHASRSAGVSIDNTRASFEALTGRFASLQKG